MINSGGGRILSRSKKEKVIGSIKLCNRHVEESEFIRQIANVIQNDCGVKPRDALHLASAIEASYRFKNRFILLEAKPSDSQNPPAGSEPAGGFQAINRSDWVGANNYALLFASNDFQRIKLPSGCGLCWAF